MSVALVTLTRGCFRKSIMLCVAILHGVNSKLSKWFLNNRKLTILTLALMSIYAKYMQVIHYMIGKIVNYFLISPFHPPTCALCDSAIGRDTLPIDILWRHTNHAQRWVWSPNTMTTVY